MTETGLLWHRAEPVELTEDHIMSVLLVRHARDDIFGQNLFSDPAWDILLELFGAKLGDRKMTTSELAKAIEAPLSTTRRWIGVLHAHGLIESAALDDENGAIELSDEGASRMERLGGRWASAFLAIT